MPVVISLSVIKMHILLPLNIIYRNTQTGQTQKQERYFFKYFSWSSFCLWGKKKPHKTKPTWILGSWISRNINIRHFAIAFKCTVQIIAAFFMFINFVVRAYVWRDTTKGNGRCFVLCIVFFFLNLFFSRASFFFFDQMNFGIARTFIFWYKSIFHKVAPI